MDSRFRIEIISATPNPQKTCWIGAHQDYSSHFVSENKGKFPSSEYKSGKIIVERFLPPGHYGILEHAHITLNCGYFPHTTVMQLRTHRLASFDVQSMRYTSESILAAANNNVDIEDVFYFRPTGDYRDRKGNSYRYSQELKELDKERTMNCCLLYKEKLKLGWSEEHARDCLSMNLRQHFVMSLNARSLIHILNLRLKKDAQLECQQFSELLLNKFCEWMPEVGNWYKEKQAYKARLSA